MCAAISCDICDLRGVYDPDSGYQYFLPRSFLESFLSGKAFDHSEFYTDEESKRLREDINELYQKILSSGPIKERLAVITAGAPGSGKTILMRDDLRDQALKGKNFAYICPDDICLKSQERTYLADIARGDQSKESWQTAYNKWRPASNGSLHLITANLIREGYGFYFGTTSSGPKTPVFYEFLKKQGYHIRVIHVSAPEEVCWASIQERDKTFVQTTKQDVLEKGLLLPQRIRDTFLVFADEIEFYYRDGVGTGAQLAARWVKNESPEPLGTLTIFAPDQYEQIKAIHNATVDVLKRPDLRWEATIEKNSG